MGFFRVGVIAAAMLLAVPSVRAETMAFEQGIDGYTGTEDNSLYSEQPDNTNGGHEFIFAGVTGPRAGNGIRRALIKFDLSALPAGSTVTSATLRLKTERSPAQEEPHTFHRLTASWGEGDTASAGPGGEGTPAQPGDATWNERFFDQQAWETPGGDFVSTPSLTVTFGEQGNVDTLGGEELAGDVQFWLDNPSQNFGWIIRGNEEETFNAKRYVSSEGEAGARPRLTVAFDPPTSPGAQQTMWVIE